MFTRIEFKGLGKSENFSYAAELAAFKRLKKLDFKPGLNVLYGPNGCGKSTVLQILGQSMCAVQGGVSTITREAIETAIDFRMALGKPTSLHDKIGLKVHHDGQPVIFCDPRQATGTSRGSFDWDFVHAGIRERMTLANNSHGEASWGRLQQAIGVLNGKAEKPQDIPSKVSRKQLNDVWARAVKMLDERMAGNIDKGQFTILLDEPEANYSVDWQRTLWDYLSRADVAEKFQIIVASHSPFVLGIPHANYIDLVPGYTADMTAMLAKHFAKLTEQP